MMQGKLTTEAARSRLGPALHSRRTEWESAANRVISSAAAHGVINSPDTRRQVGAMILQEIRLRGALCADAVTEATDQLAEEERDALDRANLEAIAVTLLAESSRELIRMRDAFAPLGDEADLPGTEYCLQAAMEVIAERLSETCVELRERA